MADEERKKLEESFNDKSLERLIGKLGKFVGFEGWYVAILNDTWISGAGPSKKETHEQSIVRGVHTPRIILVEHILEEYRPNLKLGYNLLTGKPITEHRQYHRAKEKQVPSLHYQE